MATPLRSPSRRLMAGLAFTLAVIGAYAAYTLRAVHRMRGVQTGIVERNRLASLQLIRIQNDLHSLGLAMRDILDRRDGYPLAAWKAALDRIRGNLDDAIRRESELTAARRAPEQSAYLKSSFEDFWKAADGAFAESEPARGLARVRETLQPRQEALTALVARLLVENNERESQAAAEVADIYTGIERNAYLLLGASLLLIAGTSLVIIRSNRDLFARLSDLARERSDLARQLIAGQESVFRSLSRDLHDEFGQVLTAVGALLRRTGRHPAVAADVQEVNQIVQDALEKIRSLSQSLQPALLEEHGLLATAQWHILNFERHTGIRVDSSLPPASVPMPGPSAIHVYRILQESLNNVARHAGVDRVEVRLQADGGELRLEVEDAGVGIKERGAPAGVGLAAMRERAALVGGRLTVEPGRAGGTRVALTAPLSPRVPAMAELKGAAR